MEQLTPARPAAHTPTNEPANRSTLIPDAGRAGPAACPFGHQAAPQDTPRTGPGAAAQPLPGPDDELVLPLNKRIITHYTQTAGGARELHLYYGDKEITFDEPDLFGFGEALALQSRFTAHSATQWGGPHDWTRVRDLLGQLMEEGVLRLANGDDLVPRKARDEGARPSPLPPAPASAPHRWSDSAAITKQLTGRSLDPAWLELVIPVFRVAHMSVDAEGRQVGEANVFPKALRLDVPTRWRTCIYPGSRHLSERPMNVTALKTMRAHWAQMMLVLLRVREAYLHRFPEAREGWTVGHLERLAVAVLALPTYTLVRPDKPLGNGDMHPALSCLFRVTDGLRMTMHQMLFVPVAEPTLAPEAPISSAEILAYAERNYSFHSEHGVCAGPNAMIEEFLRTLVDGKAPIAAQTATLDPEVESALTGLDEAMDYGFRGLQAHAAMFSLWPLMTRCYEELAAIAGHWPESESPPARQFKARMQGHLGKLKQATFLGEEAWRVDREAVYADMFARCGEGLQAPESHPPLGEQLAPEPEPGDEACAARLRELLEQHFAPLDTASRDAVNSLSACLMTFFVRTRAVIKLACQVQQVLNQFLRRPAAKQAFTAAEVNIHNLLQGADMRGLPYLLDEIQDEFRLVIEIDANHLTISEARVDELA